MYKKPRPWKIHFSRFKIPKSLTVFHISEALKNHSHRKTKQWPQLCSFILQSIYLNILLLTVANQWFCRIYMPVSMKTIICSSVTAIERYKYAFNNWGISELSWLSVIVNGAISRDFVAHGWAVNSRTIPKQYMVHKAARVIFVQEAENPTNILGLCTFFPGLKNRITELINLK